MALTRITGKVVDTTTDLVVGVTTVGGGVSAVDGFFSGIITAVGDASFSGNVSVGGTLTYEDVTNIDAVGLVTARNGIVVGSGITLSKDGDVFFTGIATGNGSGLTDLNASNLGSGTVPTARLGSGTASSSTFLRGDSTFQTVNTDLVSDTSPQLGGLLDGNGQTANFTANNTGLGLPRGTTSNEPSASSYEGYIRYNNDDNIVYYSDGSSWKKVSAVIPTLTSVTGDIYAGTGSTLTLAGTGFLSANLVVNFVQSSDSINENITVTPSSETAATVTVSAAIYNNVTAGNAVTIKVTNSDNGSSNSVNKTATGLPTGGTITTSGSYRIHTFTSSGTLAMTLARSVEYVIVAGGGGVGGRRHGGGGGAGGYRSNVSGESSGGGGSAESSMTLSAQNYTVTIGAGGASGPNNANSNSDATQGGTSTFNGISATGGGYGSAYNTSPGSGGSGGGSGSTNGGAISGGSGTSGQGYAGGSGTPNNNAGGGGGGGGAGAAGSNAQNSGGNSNAQNGGAGGNGVSSSITGSAVTRGGGGGGGSDTYGSSAQGGSGGGGNSANAVGSPQSGTANTGGGAGGGGSDSRTNPNGGSGVVIVRYTI